MFSVHQKKISAYVILPGPCHTSLLQLNTFQLVKSPPPPRESWVVSLLWPSVRAQQQQRRQRTHVIRKTILELTFGRGEIPSQSSFLLELPWAVWGKMSLNNTWPVICFGAQNQTVEKSIESASGAIDGREKKNNFGKNFWKEFPPLICLAVKQKSRAPGVKRLFSFLLNKHFNFVVVSPTSWLLEENFFQGFALQAVVCSFPSPPPQVIISPP